MFFDNDSGEEIRTGYHINNGIEEFSSYNEARFSGDWCYEKARQDEGIDERFIEECVDEEISMGDFVLTGGEIPAMAVADAVCRMVPGVLPEAACYEEESHWNGLLEDPQYSRPEEWHGRKVPEVLLSGHHANVATWRKRQSMLRTLRRRPDMFRESDFMGTKQDRRLLAEVYGQLRAEKRAKEAETAAPEGTRGDSTTGLPSDF